MHTLDLQHVSLALQQRYNIFPYPFKASACAAQGLIGMLQGCHRGRCYAVQLLAPCEWRVRAPMSAAQA